MAKSLKRTTFLFAAALFIGLLADRAIQPAAEAQAQQAKNAEDPQIDKCVLVEAFVVEVNIYELYKQGVNPIGQKPNSVSV